MSRLVFATAIFAAVLAWSPGVARADAAAPTDYRTTIVSVSPDVQGLVVTIEGGDSFVRMRAPDGAEVIVFGYAGEPYLRFAPDGTVSQNRLSAATYENQERYGDVDVPSFVDYAAAPVWEEIADNATWAWHDHRAHWMSPEPLIGLEPGGSLPVQAIQVTVDGRPVLITVETTLVASPSWFPAAMGVLIGLTLTILGWWLGPATATMTTLVISLAALVTGAGQYLSLPAETGPLMWWWLLPAVAFAAGVVSIATYGRSDLLILGLLALSGAQLALWGFLRRDVFTHPVLPTDIAFWFDRAATGAAVAGGTVTVVLAVQALLARPTEAATASA